jgi:hypothetical protein
MEDDDEANAAKLALWAEACVERKVSEHGFFVLAALASGFGGVRQISLVMGPFSKWLTRIAALATPVIYFWPDIRAGIIVILGAG